METSDKIAHVESNSGTDSLDHSSNKYTKHLFSESHMARLFLIVALSLFVSAPYDYIQGALYGGNPAGSAHVTFFAFGLLVGTLLQDCPLGLVVRQHRAPCESFLFYSFLLAFICLPALLDWTTVIWIAESRQSLGFFGSGAYVLTRNLLRLILPFVELAAGCCCALGVCNILACGNNAHDSSGSLDDPKSRIILSWTALILGVLIRQIVATCYSNIVNIQLASLVACIVCLFMLIGLYKLQTMLASRDTRKGVNFAWIMPLYFALGIYIWFALTRVVDIQFLANPYLTFSLLIALSFCCFYFVRRAKVLANIEDDKPHSKSEVLICGRLFQDAGLAPREAEISGYYAQGKTSGEIATLLSIKPATVRSALQRSYKKLGVSGKDEFMKLVSTQSTSLFEDTQNESATNTRRSSILSERRTFVFVGLSALLLVAPTFREMNVWGEYRTWFYFCSIVCVVFGLTQIAAQWKNDWLSGGFLEWGIVNVILYMSFAWEETLRLSTPFGLKDVAAPIVFCLIIISLIYLGLEPHRNKGQRRRLALLGIGARLYLDIWLGARVYSYLASLLFISWFKE